MIDELRRIGKAHPHLKGQLQDLYEMCIDEGNTEHEQELCLGSALELEEEAIEKVHRLERMGKYWESDHANRRG